MLFICQSNIIYKHAFISYEFNDNQHSQYMQINYHYQSVESYLKKISSSEELFFVANPGNAGDAAIALGTYHLFDKLGIAPWPFDFNDLPYVENKTIIFGGGGNLIEGKYTEMHDAIIKYLSLNNKCILLPHTIFGYEDIVTKANTKNLVIFCRDKISYKLCAIANKFNTRNIFLDNDMAFSISKEFLKPFIERKGYGIFNGFRTDAESSHSIPIPIDNKDISLSWNGAYWHDRELARVVVESLLMYLSRFKIVKTDRLHIAILSYLIGKFVYLYPNSYFKNRAVYETSLKSKQNIQYIDTSPDFANATILKYLIKPSF